MKKVKEFISLFIVIITVFIMGIYLGRKEYPKIIEKPVIVEKPVVLPDTQLIDSLNFLKKLVWKLTHKPIKPETVYIPTIDTFKDTIIIKKYGIEKGIWKIEKKKENLILYGFLKRKDTYFPFQLKTHTGKIKDLIIYPTSDTTFENAFKIIITKPSPFRYNISSGIYYNPITSSYMIGLETVLYYKRFGIKLNIYNGKSLEIPIGIVFKLKDN